MKYFKMLDHQKNDSKIDFGASPNSALKFQTRISGKKVI